MDIRSLKLKDKRSFALQQYFGWKYRLHAEIGLAEYVPMVIGISIQVDERS
jgi:hypothetical protein